MYFIFDLDSLSTNIDSYLCWL